MGDLHIHVQRLRVTEGCLDLGVTQELLHLVDGHPALKGQGGGGVAEYMRGDLYG